MILLFTTMVGPIIESPRTLKISAVATFKKRQSTVKFPDISQTKIVPNQILKLPLRMNNEDLPDLVVLCTHTDLNYNVPLSVDKSNPDTVFVVLTLTNGGTL